MTPHIEAKNDEIASTVIMPGDPLRAQYIANTYLNDVKLVNKVRNIYAYTWTFNGIKVTVMASGMGMGSMGIYSYELYKFYDVDTIIRIGTCGSYREDLDLFSVILVDKAISDSSYAEVQNGSKEKAITSSKKINEKIIETAKINNIPITVGNVYCSDVFYKEKEVPIDESCIGTEMESFALFHNATVLNKNAACILTVSNNFINQRETTAKEREQSFTQMIELALSSIIKED